MQQDFYAFGWNAYRNGEPYREIAGKSWQTGWKDCKEATEKHGPQPEA